MPTNDERRVIATGLRHVVCNWTGMGWELYLPFLSVSIRGDRDKLREAAKHLADLIDPGEGQIEPDVSTDADQGTRVDRGALLALAKTLEEFDRPEMDDCSRCPVERADECGCGSTCQNMARWCARRIREALGEAV